MNPALQAALWMTGTISSFSAMAIAGREVSLSLDTFETMMYRSVFGMLIVVSLITATGRWHEITAQKFGLHVVRNTAHFIGQNLWFFAVTVIPLAQVFALEFTMPIWAILLSPLLLGERLTRPRMLAAALGFVGVLIVARPGVMGINAGVITAASAAVFFALTALFTRRLTRTASIACIMFYLTTIQLMLGLITSGYDGDIALPDSATLPWVALIGAAGLIAHFCLTKALSIAPAAVVTPIDFVRLPTIAVIGMLLYGESLDPWVFVGALIIFVGNYLNILAETRNTSTSG